MSKRYWLFTFAGYYPEGGMNDYHGAFNSIEEAQAAANDDCAHILDIKTMTLVKYGTSIWKNGNPTNLEWEWRDVSKTYGN